MADLIHRLQPGDEVSITENEKTVAKLVATSPEQPLKPRQLGTMKGSVLYMAPDFDAPMDNFAMYM